MDIIIEDDPGEVEEEVDENLPYELSKQAVVTDMKIKMIMVSEITWQVVLHFTCLSRH